MGIFKEIKTWLAEPIGNYDYHQPTLGDRGLMLT